MRPGWALPDSVPVVERAQDTGGKTAGAASWS